MEQMYNVSSNPHVRDKMTTSRIMQLVVIALLPTTLFGIWNFGFRAFLVVLVTVASSVFFEWLYNRLKIIADIALTHGRADRHWCCRILRIYFAEFGHCRMDHSNLWSVAV